MKEYIDHYYVCELCGTKYADPQNAQHCESSHEPFRFDPTYVKQSFQSFFNCEQHKYPSDLTIHHNGKKIVYAYFSSCDENGSREDMGATVKISRK